MNLKNIERESAIYYSIKRLDEDIIKLERLAEKIANGETEMSLEIKIRDLKKQRDQANKDLIDTDGYDIKSSFRAAYMSYFNPIYGLGVDPTKPKDESIESYFEEISEFYSLHLVGFLVADKKAKREKLLHQLEQLRRK